MLGIVHRSVSAQIRPAQAYQPKFRAHGRLGVMQPAELRRLGAETPNRTARASLAFSFPHRAHGGAEQSASIGGALAYLLRTQGVNPAREGSIVALLSTCRTTIYFLWSPITDFWIRRRTWLIDRGRRGRRNLLAAFHQSSLASSRAVGLIFLSACFGQLIVAALRRNDGHAAAAKPIGAAPAASTREDRWPLARSRFSCWYRSPRGCGLSALGWIAAAMIALPAFAALAAT